MIDYMSQQRVIDFSISVLTVCMNFQLNSAMHPGSEWVLYDDLFALKWLLMVNCFVCQIIYAGENKFRTLPRNIGLLVRLEELDVSGCEIEYLPESLSECRSLQRLWLSNNRYVHISISCNEVLTYVCRLLCLGCLLYLITLGNCTNWKSYMSEIMRSNTSQHLFRD